MKTVEEKEKRQGNLGQESGEGEAMGKSFSPPPFQLKASSIPSGKQPIQMFRDEEHAQEKGWEFRRLSQEESHLNETVNQMLAMFMERPSREMHGVMMGVIEEMRLQIKEIHAQLVEILNEYEGSSDTQQQAYFRAYLEDKPDAYGAGPHANPQDPNLTHDEVGGIFNRISGRTDTTNDINDVPQRAERSRFLMFVMQGLHDDIGVDQYRNLDRNLGDRRILVDRVGPNNLSGGMENAPRDGGFARKTDDGNVGQDPGHLQNGGSGLGFLQEKFAQPYVRGENPQRDQIGNMQVNMDRDNELLPIFAGQGGGGMEMFTGPKKMTVHHEVGHMNSMLEGKSGEGQAMGGELSRLTDQEEMYNIWGGPRSDRAYGQELGLPQRFDHQSLVTYFAMGSGTYEDFMGAIQSGYEFTSTLPEAQGLLLDQIRRLINSDWSAHKKGWGSTPKGIGEIRGLVNAPQPDLNAIIAAAIQNRDRDSSNRTAFTQEFYNDLGAIVPANKINVIQQMLILKGKEV